MGKKLFPLWVFLAILAAGGLIYLGVHFVAGNYLSSEKDKTDVAKCETTHTSRQAVIENGRVNPANIDGKLCDKLTIINKDNRVRLIAFGVHDKHQDYDGVSEKALKQNESFTIELNQAGTFLFHDHYQDEAKGTFTVTN